MTLTMIDEAPAPAAQPHVTVLTDRCAGCQECVIRCPAGALTMDASRWVAVADDALCVGCRQCERTCPFSAINVEGPLLVAGRADPEPAHPERLTADTSEVRPGIGSWEEALTEASRCLDCPDPTCVRGCPAHNDIPSFIRALRDGDLTEAHDVLRRTSVLPDICSRVCDQAAQCEGACTWSLAGGTPVAIGKLERFVADHAPVPPPVRATGGAGLSAAVVGSGPAGIAAAWQLVEGGASVTVYERAHEPGGLLDWGIPDFTLPAAVAARPWQQLTAAGVELRCNTDICTGDIDRLLAEYDAVVLAHGAAQPLRLPVPGTDLDGVTDATSFLQAGKAALRDGGDVARFRESFALPAPPPDGQEDAAPQILVLGAGNTAMDVARTARRLGLRAVCVDWVDERFALARPDELAEARQEGVEVRFLRTLARLEDEGGRVRRAALAVTRQNRADRLPAPVDGHPEMLDVDLVVMAMGYRNDPAYREVLPGIPVAREAKGIPDRRWLASGVLASPAPEFARYKPVGKLALGREAGLAAAALPVQERLWAAGDALVGPSTVVEAMAQGRRAAASVLAARPTRPGRHRPGGPQRVLVAYESRGGRTARAAKAVASAFFGNGDHVQVLPVAKIGPLELAAADLLVVGSWVEGLAVARVRPAKAMRTWLASLPRLGGKPVAIFCTFAVAPKGALPAMRQALAAKGAVVVARAAFGPRELGPGAGVFGPAAFGAELVLRTSPGRAPRALIE